MSILAWQLPRQLTIVCALVGRIGRLLFLGRVASLGREVELNVLGWSLLAAKLVSALWFASEN